MKLNLLPMIVQKTRDYYCLESMSVIGSFIFTRIKISPRKDGSYFYMSKREDGKMQGGSLTAEAVERILSSRTIIEK